MVLKSVAQKHHIWSYTCTHIHTSNKDYNVSLAYVIAHTLHKNAYAHRNLECKTHTHTPVCTHIHTKIPTHTHAHTLMHTSTHTPMHYHQHTCSHTHTQNTYIQ